MKRVVVVLVVGLLFCLYSPAAAQLLRGPGNVFSYLNTAGMTVSPILKVAYKRLGLNCNFSIPVEEYTSAFGVPPLFGFADYGSLLDLYPMDLKLEDANLLIGEAGVSVRMGQAAKVFLKLSASVPQKVGVRTNETSSIGMLGPPRAYAWQGTRLQWTQLNLGGSYSIWPDVAVVAGIKCERTTFKFADPKPIPATAIPTLSFSLYWDPVPPDFGLNINFGPVPVTLNQLRGEAHADLTIPYVGLELEGSYYRAWFIGGLCNASLGVPLRLSQDDQYGGFNVLVSVLLPPVVVANGGLLLGRSDLNEEARYSLANAGLYLETGLEYDVQVTNNLTLTLWGEATWMRIQGTGNLDLRGQSSWFYDLFASWNVFGGLFTGDFDFGNAWPQPFGTSSSGKDSGFSQYSYALGLTGTLNF